MASKAFSCLPLHLVSHMLRKLDSMQTLGSAILSHPTFYAAFNEDAHSIIRSILMSQMGSQTRTLYYAIAAYEASLVDYKNHAEVKAFLHDRFVLLSQDANFDFEAHTSHIKPKVAAALSKTQVIVNYFTKGFINDTLPRCLAELDIRASENPQDCSDREIFRIQRALYRYQTHCSLSFRSIDDLVDEFHSYYEFDNVNHEVFMVRKPFFFSHSAWENEQLACVLDYLESVLSRSFDEVAKFDIAWGAHEIEWLLEGAKSRIKQAYLSLGLAFLHKLDHATDYPSRYQILTQEGYGDCTLHPPTNGMSVSRMIKGTRPFDDSNEEDFDFFDTSGTPLREQPKAMMQMMRPQGPLSIFDQAKTSDPEHMWYLAHYRYPVCCCQNMPLNIEARRCGYVMWDMRNPRPGARDVVRKIKALREKTRNLRVQRLDELDAVKESWRRRRLLYDEGVRGHVETAMRDDDGKTQVSETQSSS